MKKIRDLAIVISGRRVLQAGGKVSAKALRQTCDWYLQGKAKGPVWLEQSKRGRRSLR